jgi:UDP:flavonoid glycosyltransferase YjiC (YdhE family)
VLESLAYGVPQVAIPVTYDHPGVAARIVNRQTGVATSLDKLTADHLSALLNEVLSNSTYRNSARTLQKAIAVNGLAVAAQVIEQTLRVRRTRSKRLTTSAAFS